MAWILRTVALPYGADFRTAATAFSSAAKSTQAASSVCSFSPLCGRGTATRPQLCVTGALGIEQRQKASIFVGQRHAHERAFTYINVARQLSQYRLRKKTPANLVDPPDRFFETLFECICGFNHRATGDVLSGDAIDDDECAPGQFRQLRLKSFEPDGAGLAGELRHRTHPLAFLLETVLHCACVSQRTWNTSLPRR
jgi:hypothetical protein